MKATIIFAIFICAIFGIFGCGSSGDDDNDHRSSTQPAQLMIISDPTIECQSTLLVETHDIEYPRNVKSIIDDQLYLAYFSSAGNGNFSIIYQRFNMNLSTDIQSSVIQVDHSRDIQFILTTEGTPLYMYQGGSYPTCGEIEQSDIMLSVLQNNQWQEFTVSEGTVERNPVINNGLVGYSSDMIVDSTNTIHMCFQFLYEGCDSMNYNYPDLWYIQFSLDQLNDLPDHEVVEGNDYDNSNKQNNAGEHCSIALNHHDAPFIFYYFEDTLPKRDHGLRVAYRTYPDNWETQWIDIDIHVDYISSSWNESQEKMAVAYYVTQNSYGNRNNVLMFAEQTQNGWQSSVVDKSCSCGNYCSLTFDSNGDPIIAYQADQTRSGIPLKQLKIAYRKSGLWKCYFCAALNHDSVRIKNIGVDNTIHLEEHSFFMTSFSYETHAIYVITGDLNDLQ